MINPRILRIKSKLDELYGGKIDLSDVRHINPDSSEFYTRAIAAQAIVMFCGIEEDVAAACITDGYHDIGIDAVYSDTAQKKLILVQSKWRKDAKGSITQDEAGKFVEGIKRVIFSDFDGCNAKLVAKQEEIIAALKDPDFQVEAIFCHTGNQQIADYAKRTVTDLLKQVNEDGYSELLVFSEIRCQDIYEFLANGQANDYIVLDDVLLNNWGTVDEPYKAYYGTLPAAALGKWYEQFGNKLFAKNIRYYKGSTEVNQGIRDVLKNNPDKFFYYNNGVKMLCQSVSRKAAYSADRATGLFVLEGVSVVNGAQTTGAIGALYKDCPEGLEKAIVFVQIIALNDAGEEQATLITRLSNTQNKIESKDFAALDPVQERLKVELSFSGIQYLYKSGAIIDEPKTQITLDEAIVAQSCAQDDLSIIALAKRNIGALTEDITKTPYLLLFNGTTNSITLYNSIHVMRMVESFLSLNEKNSMGRRRLVLVHGNRYILHCVLKEMKKRTDYSVRFLNDEEIQATVFDLCETKWETIFEAMENVLPDAYPANIFKNVGRLREIEGFIEQT